MSRLYNILNAIITKLNGGAMITSASSSVTVGSSSYDGRYYADKSVSTPTGYSVLCIKITSTTDNRMATVQPIYGTNYRVFTNQANTAVSFTVYYYKTIG